MLLSRQGTNCFPLQNLEASLYHVIHGSDCASTADIEEVLVLLIKTGADIYERDLEHGTISDLVCSRITAYRIESREYQNSRNHDFVLRELWSRALTRCGFDAEDVIQTSLRLEKSALAFKSQSEAGLGLISPRVFCTICEDDEESEIDNEDYEDFSEEDKCGTIYDESEESIEVDNEMDTFRDEQSASSEGLMEMDPEESNRPFLSSEDRIFLEQDAQVWME